MARKRAAKRNPRVPRSVSDVAELIQKPHSIEVKALLKMAEETEKGGDRTKGLDLAYVARISADTSYGSGEWFTKVRGDYGYHMNAAKRKLAAGDAKGAKQHQNVVDTWNRRFKLAIDEAVLPKGTVEVTATAPAAAPGVPEPSEEELASLVEDVEGLEPSAEDLAGLVESVQEEQAAAPPPPEMPAPPPEPAAPPPPQTPFIPRPADGGLKMTRLVKRFWLEPHHDRLQLDEGWRTVAAGIDPTNPARWWVIAELGPTLMIPPQGNSRLQVGEDLRTSNIRRTPP